MKYKLINNSLNDTARVKETFLLNRGIENWKDYLNLTSKNVQDYMDLENIEEAARLFEYHIEQKKPIHIIVDPDVDGYTSASMIYRYIKHIDENADVTYSLHTEKQHGITKDITIPDNCSLLIVPDAGSNDVEQCKELAEKGIDILILDHHICDKKNDYAVIVNNQLSPKYKNKNLSGAGIVYRFLQKVDEDLWDGYAEELLDLCALGNISDVMDMREFETRYLVDKGISKIKSKAFRAFIRKQEYSMNNIVNINNIQFYITPMLNACMRVASQEDKDILFRAMIETDEEFDYKKRGETETIKESVYDRAARLCVNAKARQAKEVEKDIKLIEEIIAIQGLDNNKVLFVDVTDILRNTLTGYAAIKLAEKYNKPCVVLNRRNNVEYGGSCRNFDYSPIENLKDLLMSTGAFNFVQGHENAAGISINEENVIAAIKNLNEQLSNIDFTKIYMCDFDLECEENDISFIKAVDDMKELYGQKVREPLIHVSNIPVNSADVFLMGKELNTWKVTIDGIAYVKFSNDKSTDSILLEYDNLGLEEDKDLGVMDVVGTVNINNYNGKLTPQFIVKDYVFRKE